MLCVQDMAMCEEAEQMTVQEVEGEGPPSPTSADDPKGTLVFESQNCKIHFFIHLNISSNFGLSMDVYFETANNKILFKKKTISSLVLLFLNF